MPVDEVVDVHTHILPRDIPRWAERFGSGGFMTLEHIPGTCRAKMVRDDGRFFREVDDNCFSAAARTRAGIAAVSGMLCQSFLGISARMAFRLVRAGLNVLS